MNKIPKSTRAQATNLKRGGGRKKGVPNKLTATLKTMVEQAFHKAGGVTYLVRMSKLEPKAFLSLLSRLLPMQVEGSLTHHVARMPEVAKDTDEWAKQYTPTAQISQTRQ